MADIPDYLDALVADGVNAIRCFCQSNDNTPGHWESWKVTEYGYEDHLRQILTWVRERELTMILCVTPYGDRTPLPNNLYQSLINLALEFHPYVIIEPENEPQDMGINQKVVALAQAMGFPNTHIQVEFVDSSEYGDMLLNTLGGKGIGCLHFVASMDGINAPWPNGWTTSEGMMRYVRELGLYPSTDGGTDGHDGQFPWWANDPAGKDAHCASPTDCYEMAKWNLKEGGRGLEYLGPAMFANDYPNVRLAIEGGRPWREEMRRAYNEVIHA